LFATALLAGGIVSLARYVQSREGRSAQWAVADTRGSLPAVATVKREGWFEAAEIEEIKPGEQMTIKPGQSVPLDSRVVEGEARVEEWIVTGADGAVTKGVGDPLLAGSLVREGTLVAEVSAASADCVLARLSEQAGRAGLHSRGPVLRRAGLWADAIMLVLIGLALAVVVPSMVSESAGGAGLVPSLAALLLAAAPSLLVAAPLVAYGVGIARLARSGLSVRSAEALQAAGGARRLVIWSGAQAPCGVPAGIAAARELGLEARVLVGDREAAGGTALRLGVDEADVAPVQEQGEPGAFDEGTLVAVAAGEDMSRIKGSPLVMTLGRAEEPAPVRGAAGSVGRGAAAAGMLVSMARLMGRKERLLVAAAVVYHAFVLPIAAFGSVGPLVAAALSCAVTLILLDDARRYPPDGP
jgi:cation transport ATPase